MGQVKSELRRAGNSCLVVHVFVERFHPHLYLLHTILSDSVIMGGGLLEGGA